MVPGILVLVILVIFPILRTAAASEVSITGFSFVQDTARGPWAIEARHAVFQEGEGVVLDAVSARMVTGDGEELSVVSDKGHYDPEKLVLDLEGHVLARHEGGFILKAGKVTWDGTGATLRIREEVEMAGQALRVNGESALYEIDGQAFLFTGGVQTILDLKGETP